MDDINKGCMIAIGTGRSTKIGKVTYVDKRRKEVQVQWQRVPGAFSNHFSVHAVGANTPKKRRIRKATDVDLSAYRDAHLAPRCSSRGAAPAAAGEANGEAADEAPSGGLTEGGVPAGYTSSPEMNGVEVPQQAAASDAVMAGERGEEEAVPASLDSGGRVNATYERGGVSGLTLLMSAAGNGHERVVELLIRHGAEIDKQNYRGRTALMSAASYGHERVVELLLQRGAEINKQDSDGFSALMVAAGSGHERVVELLLRRGAEVDLQKSTGRTALMSAA